MKKLLLYSLAGLLAPVSVFAQNPTVRDLDFDVQHAHILVFDVDMDGDMDILISGDSDRRVVQLFKNDGFGTFTKEPSPFKALGMASMDIGDIDGDGNPDVIQSGFTDDENAPIYVGIMRSNAEGVFAEDQALTAALPKLAPTSGFADLNNDGYTDVYVFGNNAAGKSKIFFNNRQGGFTESAQFENYSFLDPHVSVVDFDNDGDMDLFINTFDIVNDTRLARMFVNENGTFTERNLNIIEKSYGSATWGDFDADGDMDLLLNGDGGFTSGEESNYVYRLYRNDAGIFTEAATFRTYRQISVGGGGRFADWDNDGDLDVIVTGWSPDETRQATAIFLNNNGTFALSPVSPNLPGFSESHVEVGHFNMNLDNAIDMVLTGFSGNTFNNTALNKRATVIITNASSATNNAPGAPATAQATTTGNTTTLTWGAGTDDKTPATGLTYNIYVRNQTTGRYFMTPLADLETGTPYIHKIGNVQSNRSWRLMDLPVGEYIWGVQAVDNGFLASGFATGNFTIAPTSLNKNTIIADMQVFPNPAKGEFTVRFDKGFYNITVFGVDGREVNTTLATRETRLTLAPGVYVVRATSTDGSSTAVKRVIIN